MTIQYDRVKVTSNGTAPDTDFTLGPAVAYFTNFKQGEVRYVALAESGKWQVGKGTVSGITLSRGTVEDSYTGNKEQIDFTGEVIEIAQVSSANYLNEITNKLLGIESGATADMTPAEIKASYESNDDTNAFDDSEKLKLEGVEYGASSDQTGAEIKVLYEAEPDTNVFDDNAQNKLSGIEDNATRDLDAGEVKILYESNDDTNVFDDELWNKLANIEPNATADQIASDVYFEFTATIPSSNVQSAIENVDYAARNVLRPSTISSYIPDDDPITDAVEVQSALVEHGQNIIDRVYSATGLLGGGKLSGSINTTVFTIAMGEGLFANSYTDPTQNVIPSRASWDAINDVSISPENQGVSVASIGVLLALNGATVTVVKIVGKISPSYYKDHIFLGRISVVDGVISAITNAPIVAKQTSDNANEDIIGSSTITGAAISPVDNALSVWQSAGELYYPGINWHDSDHKNSNRITFESVGTSIDPLPFNVINQLGIKQYSNLTVIPSEYDNGGTLTAIPATQATIHRLYAIGLNTGQRKFILLPGQNLYANATEAKERLAGDSVDTPIEVDSLSLVAYIGATADAANFNDYNTAWIISSISQLASAGDSVNTVEWSNITGAPRDNSALNDELNGKANTVHTHVESDITDLDKYSQSEVDSLVAGSVSEAEKRVVWRGYWQDGETYNLNDEAYQDGFLGFVINPAGTQDLLAPQFTGQPSWGIPTDAVMDTVSVVGYVRMVHRYTMTKAGYLQQITVKLPNWSIEAVSRITVINHDYGKVTVMNYPIVTPADTWVVVTVASAMVNVGSVFEIWFGYYNRQLEFELKGNWDSNEGTGIPASQEFNIDSISNPTEIQINHTDLNGDDKQLELDSVVAGSYIELIETDDASRNMSFYTVGVPDTVSANSTKYAITDIIEGSKEIRVNKNYSITIQAPLTDITEYPVIVDFFTNNAPDWATVDTELYYSNVQQAASKDAYGINLLFQEAEASDDWELVYLNSIVSSSPSNSLSNFGTDALPNLVSDAMPYFYDKRENIMDVPEEPAWTEIGHLDVDTAEGIYEFSFSSSFVMSDTNDSIKIRYSLDDGITWEEFRTEPKDNQDVLSFTYFAPIEHFGGVFQIRVELSKTSGGNTLDCLSANTVFKRVG